MIYIIITVISIVTLSIIIIWKAIKQSNKIVSNVNENITNLQFVNKTKEQNEQVLSDLRTNFLEAQTSGIDRITYIGDRKKELEKYLEKSSSGDDQFTY